MPKPRIFMLWLQGWKNAPPIAKACRRSWEVKNPGWEVVALDNRNLRDWTTWHHQVPNPGRLKIKRCHVADIARLNLLSVYGGVWDSLEHVNNYHPHYFHRVGFNGPLTEKVREHVDSATAPVYKLTHKKGRLVGRPRIRYLLNA